MLSRSRALITATVVIGFMRLQWRNSRCVPTSPTSNIQTLQ